MSNRRNQFVPEFFLAAVAIVIAIFVGFAIVNHIAPTPTNCYGARC